MSSSPVLMLLPFEELSFVTRVEDDDPENEGSLKLGLNSKSFPPITSLPLLLLISLPFRLRGLLKPLDGPLLNSVP